MFRSLLQNSKGRAVLVAVMLIVLAVVWQPVLNNNFLTNWDDQWMVAGNPHLLEVTYLNTISTDAIATTFSEPYGGQYSPVNTRYLLEECPNRIAYDQHNNRIIGIFPFIEDWNSIIQYYQL